MSDRQTGITSKALAECITNISLGTRAYYIVHSLQFGGYCLSLACKIAFNRGHTEVRLKARDTLALKNGGAELKIITFNYPYLYRKSGYAGFGITGIHNCYIAIDHMAYFLK